jgi:carboxyl-terminal processing protease
MEEKIFGENEESLVVLENAALKRRLAVLENYREETERNRKGDKISGGVIGALLGALIALLVMIPLVFSLKIGNGQPSQGSTGDTLTGIASDVDLNKIQNIFDYLDTYFLYDIDMDKVEDAMLHGLMTGLGDDYACYYNEEEFNELL